MVVVQSYGVAIVMCFITMARQLKGPADQQSNRPVLHGVFSPCFYFSVFIKLGKPSGMLVLSVLRAIYKPE